MMRSWLAPSSRPPIETVKRRLSALAPLTEEAESLLGQLNGRRLFPGGADILGEPGEPHRLSFITSGWAARVGLLPDGRRQVLGLLLPGDPLYIGPPTPGFSPGPAMSLTPVEVVDAESVRAAATSGETRWRCLQDALLVSSRLHEAYLLDQILRLGRMKAYERICHLLLELRARLMLAGLSNGGRFHMPLTQETLGDTAGLSTVHVNRTLQALRRENVLHLRSGEATLLDAEAMAAACDYHAPEPSWWSGLIHVSRAGAA